MELVSLYIKETVISTLPEELRENQIRNLDNFDWYNYGPRIKNSPFINKGLSVHLDGRSYRMIVQFKRKSSTSETFMLKKPAPIIVFEIEENVESNEYPKIKIAHNGTDFKDTSEFVKRGIPQKAIDITIKKLVQDLTVEVM